ncbi:hypothetical protein OO006_09180 [Prosthecochloris sp. SCSIO W1101]|uniref:hypothetical protein n=1 Tax=Prosthecochloris sp. SCSIO W1101 TaxID=2992242 RepID=UPI00223CCFDF|nr:hypothetical protein [Prosthecochloris sp. SCSIO W1101]UZJ40529.1 hypothetical protein OO006_09180 [Prosthecochloris sp. SCSIO W1101]
MVKVKLRKKAISKGSESLYLDFWQPVTLHGGKKRGASFLACAHIKSQTNNEQKVLNRETRTAAETISSKKPVELQAEAYGFAHLHNATAFRSAAGMRGAFAVR